MTTTIRTFGLGDSAEQTDSMSITQAHATARACKERYQTTHKLRDLMDYWRATRRADRLQARYESRYGLYTPGEPAPFED